MSVQIIKSNVTCKQYQQLSLLWTQFLVSESDIINTIIAIKEVFPVQYKMLKKDQSNKRGKSVKRASSKYESLK